MPPWLQSAGAEPGESHPAQLAARLVLALLLGWVVSAIYRRTAAGEPVASFRATLVLLTILIAAVTQVIGDNVARAFSLVGALSIVRFRTVVQDTRDTAFVIFAVTVGMAVGAGDLWVAGLALVVVGTAAVAAAWRGRATEAGTSCQLAVTLLLAYEPEKVLAPVLREHATRFQVVGVATALRGAGMETSYAVRLRPGASAHGLVNALNRLEGVQAIQLSVPDAALR